MTAIQYILENLKKGKPMAIHQFETKQWSQNNIATRLNDLERKGLLESSRVAGKPYKQWKIRFNADENGQGVFL